MDQHVQTHSAPTRRASDLPPENRATDGASPAPALTRLGAVLRAARGSRPLTSLSGDQLAMGLSGLCLVHCLASTIFFASIASVSGVPEHHLFHEIGLVVAIGFALVTLVAGWLSHGYMKIGSTSGGE